MSQDGLLMGRFRVERAIGRGASGVVYRAIDQRDDKPVALKILRIDLLGDRISGEADVLADIAHPGIVSLVASGNIDEGVRDGDGHTLHEGAPFLVMEWLDGEDLDARRKHAPLTLREALDVCAQIADALHAAHTAGVVHRDIKPSNVFLLPSEEGRAPRVKIVDFGVAGTYDVLLEESSHDDRGMVGTPAYMAPEQARGDAIIDARCDIYSLGATLFELIAGYPPHMGATSIATLARLASMPAPRLSEMLLEVPPKLDDLIHRMLASDPADRPSSAAEVAEELRAIASDPELPGATMVAPTGDRVASSGTRLVTTLVALNVATSDERVWEIERLRQQGADVLPLGADALIAHLGAQRAYGNEGTRALELGLQLSARGARVGVATGRMHVDRTRSAGEVVERAAALAREAAADGVLTDSATAELARGRFQFKTLPRGLAKVVGLKMRRDPGTIAPFVGREGEFFATLAAFDRCADERTPVFVSVSGPPGIGKTRLSREFSVAARTPPRTCRLMQIRCESYGTRQALGVVADALRTLVGLPKGATLAQAERALAASGLPGADNVLLASLLANRPFPEGIDPRGARDSIYLSTTELVLEASREPTAILIEDAQWSDPESIAWLDHVLGRATHHPLFVMAMVRPSFWRTQGQRFVGRDHVRIELRPIAKRAAREIALAVIGPGATEGMLEQIAQQAAGSPLFAEELARVIASGRDVAKTPTIEAAIQVSLDALDDASRDAVVRSSVFGMSVWDLGMAAVGVPDPQAALNKLIAAELFVELGRARFEGTREYLFKHALVREVAYASTGEERRVELHAEAARWLGQMGEDAATVAQHFDLGKRHEEAAAHWEIAARRALATNSLREAVTMADRALTFAEDKATAFARAQLLDEAYSRLDARASERDSAIRAMSESVFDEASEVRTLGARVRYDDACGSGDDIEGRLTAVRERAKALDLIDEEARCSATLAHRHAFAGALTAAEREAAHLLDLAERRQIVWAAVDAWQTLAVAHQTRGELAAALSARRSAAKAARDAKLQEREAMLTMNVGFALTTIGAWEEALREIEDGLVKAKAIGSDGAVRHGRMVLLGWAATYGADSRLDAELAEPRAAADEAASGGWVVRDRATLGVLFYRGCELLRGDAANLSKARSLLKTAAEAYRSTDNRDVLPVALGFWAEAERLFGDAEHAADIAREACALVEGGAPSLLNEAPLYLALHDAYVDLGDLARARDAMERGIVPIMRRLKGLEGTPYARSFLLGLPHNSALLAAAEAYGCIPPEIAVLLDLGDA